MPAFPRIFYQVRILLGDWLAALWPPICSTVSHISVRSVLVRRAIFSLNKNENRSEKRWQTEQNRGNMWSAEMKILFLFYVRKSLEDSQKIVGFWPIFLVSNSRIKI